MITILTPTFNRAHTLPRLYQSLVEQDSNSFEWVVVDDGSSDGTRELIDGFQREGRLRIVYCQQENAGKHVAVNTGVTAATGEFIFIVDSDDALVASAVSLVERAVQEHNLLALQGVCFRKILFDRSMVGRICESVEPVIMSPTDAGKYFHGDLAYVFRREAMLACPFPVIKGEKFVPELYIWNKIGDLGKVIYFPATAIYLCDYLPDGYTNNFPLHLRRNPRGFSLFYSTQIGRERSLKLKAKYTVRTLQCYVYMGLRAIKGKPLA